MHPRALHCEHLHFMQTDRVGPIGRPGAEHAPLWARGVVTGMDEEEISAGTIQPGQHDDVVTGLEVTKPLRHRRLELEPGRRCSFVTLLRRRSRVDQLRLHPGDHPELIGTIGHVGLPASRASVAYRRSVSSNVGTRAPKASYLRLVAARQSCTVKSRPAHLGDDAIGAVVADGWGLRVEELHHLPVGGGAHHWSALADDGRRWFVTCDDLATKPWLGSDPEVVFDGLRSAYRTAVALRDAGLPFVAAPVIAPSGTPAVRVDERHSVSVSEYVDGDAGGWGQRVPASRREELVTMLARLHLATPPGTTALRPFAVPGRAELDAALDDLGRPWDAGPFSEPARRALANHVEVVTQATAELDRLIDQLAAPDGRTVVTHGEPHPGNLIQTSARLVLIDWDTVALARPERDLWMIDDPEAAIHYRQLTGITPEPEAMAGYRLLWALTDVAAFTVELRRPHRRDADGEHALRGLRSILSGAEPSPYGQPATWGRAAGDPSM